MSFIDVKCVDCGKMRSGQEGIKEPRCYNCFAKWERKQAKEIKFNNLNKIGGEHGTINA